MIRKIRIYFCKSKYIDERNYLYLYILLVFAKFSGRKE